MRNRDPKDYLALALDNLSDLNQIARLVRATSQSVGIYKIGLEQYIRFGPEIFGCIREIGAKIFLDLKLHDIPNTVSKAVTAAAVHEVDYLTVHTSGGNRMLAAAVEAASRQYPTPALLGVTLLTSVDATTLKEELLVEKEPSLYARHLASLAKRSGLQGIVCSAADLAEIRDPANDQMEIVTPGIRRIVDSADDQKRICTPELAIRAGATMLVVGRPINSAESPSDTAAEFLEEITNALREMRNC